MTDIAGRLRSHVRSRLPGEAPVLPNGAWQMMLDAADRIEDLERGLNIIAQAGTLYGGAWCVAQALGHIHNLDFDMWPETGRPPDAAKRDLTESAK